MEFSIIQVVLFALIAFIIGFVIAWIAKKSYAAKATQLEQLLEAARTQSAMLETEKQYLKEEKQQLSECIEITLSHLEKSREEATAFSTRLASSSEQLVTAKQEHS